MLTQLFSAKDDKDQLVLSEICNPMMFQLQLEAVVFRGDVEKKDRFVTAIMGVTGALLKANEHCRKYHIYERQQLLEILKNTRKNKSSDIGYNPVELTGEVDAFLTQIKSSLDQLALSLDPLFGFKLKNWGKVKNPESGKEESGFGVLSCLKNNLPSVKKGKSSKLIELLEKNIDWLSYLVFLRDNPVHKGGSKNITPITTGKVNDRVVPQRIIHSPESFEDVSMFMDRTMSEIIWFISNFLLGSVELLAPGLLLIKTPNGYGWDISKKSE